MVARIPLGQRALNSWTELVSQSADEVSHGLLDFWRQRRSKLERCAFDGEDHAAGGQSAKRAAKFDSRRDPEPLAGAPEGMLGQRCRCDVKPPHGPGRRA